VFNFYIATNIIYVSIAIILDFILGDPSWFPHPIIYIGKLISALENYFRKITKDCESLKVYGGLIVIIVGLLTFTIPYFLLKLSLINIYLFHILNIFIIWTTIAAKSLDKAGTEVYKSLQADDLETARLKLSYIVGRDTKNLSKTDIIRADIETIAENTSDGVIAPIFYGIIGGAPLAMMYKGINTIDSMLGYLTEKYKCIGFYPAKLDDLFNLIPARLTGILICLSSPIVKGNIINSFKIMIRDRKNHKSPNSAYPEASVASAIKIQLGGTNIYFGEKIYKPSIGDNNKALEYNDIIKAIILMYSSEILLIIMVLIFLLFVIGMVYQLQFFDFH
jgi:adenosylcobinamide-phosphate synthase